MSPAPAPPRSPRPGSYGDCCTACAHAVSCRRQLLLTVAVQPGEAAAFCCASLTWWTSMVMCDGCECWLPPPALHNLPPGQCVTGIPPAPSPPSPSLTSAPPPSLEHHLQRAAGVQRSVELRAGAVLPVGGSSRSTPPMRSSTKVFEFKPRQHGVRPVSGSDMSTVVGPNTGGAPDGTCFERAVVPSSVAGVDSLPGLWPESAYRAGRGNLRR